MSRVDNLLMKLCPDGVPFLEVAELFDLRNGYTPSKKNASYWTGGNIPWFRMEDLRINGSVLDRALQQIPETAVKGGKLFPAGSLLMATSATIGEHALVTVPHLSNQRFTSLAVKAQYSARVEIKFLYYYAFILGEWCRNNTTTSSFASVDMVGFRRFRIPVPPLEVQREIVRILDQFMQLEAELEAELEARQSQYEHYRELLIGSVNGMRRPLGDLGTFSRGRRFTKRDYVEDGLPSIHYGEIYTEYGCSATETVRFVRRDLQGQLRYAEPGDVIFAGVGETVVDVGKAVAWLGEVPVAVHDDTFAFTTDLNPKFVAYAVQTEDFDAQKERHVARGKVKRLSAQGIASISIPVPDRAEQDEVVAMLDKFDALVYDISIGLPAEITARRKQYEYYRDRLLTLEEAST